MLAPVVLVACGHPAPESTPRPSEASTDAAAPALDSGVDLDGSAPRPGIDRTLLQQRYSRPVGVGEQPIPFVWPSDVRGDVEIVEIPRGSLSAEGVALSVGSVLSPESFQAARYLETGREAGAAGSLRFTYMAPSGERADVTINIEWIVHPCDELAADPLDPNRYAEGTHVEKTKASGLPNFLDPEGALPFCEAAHADYSDVPRFMVQLGRCHSELGDYEASFALAEQAAALGDALGIGSLGYHYVLGRGVAQDLSGGFALLAEVAELGYPGAQHQVALMLQDGLGVAQDEVAALGPLTAAAEYGFHWSQLRLGTTYRDGRGTPVDFDQARMWFERAAAQNNGHAFHNLGVSYRLGRGVEADGTIAEMYLLRAAEFDLEWAYYELGLLYLNGAPGIAPDRDKAIDYLTRAAEAGVDPARDALMRAMQMAHAMASFLTGDVGCRESPSV